MYSISFSISFINRLNKDIIVDMIEFCNRSIDLSRGLYRYTISYEDVEYGSVNSVREISIDKIDSLLDKDISYMCITFSID